MHKENLNKYKMVPTTVLKKSVKNTHPLPRLYPGIGLEFASLYKVVFLLFFLIDVYIYNQKHIRVLCQHHC